MSRGLIPRGGYSGLGSDFRRQGIHANRSDNHAQHGIATEAWSPLAQGGGLLGDAAVTRLARTYDVSPAQVILRWHVQLGNVVIPKSVTPARIRQNIDVFAFELTSEDMRTLTKLDNGGRIGPNPDTFG